MAETIKVRNISGNDLDVGAQNTPQVTVPAGHQHEFSADVARSLLEQTDVWAEVGATKKSAATEDKE